jgi:hypothetical protein
MSPLSRTLKISIQFVLIFSVLLALSPGCSKKNDPAIASCQFNGYTYSNESLTISYNSAGKPALVHYVNAQLDATTKLSYDNSGRLSDVFNPANHQKIISGSNGLVSEVQYYNYKKDGGDSLMFERDRITYNSKNLADSLIMNDVQYQHYVYDSKGNLSWLYNGYGNNPDFNPTRFSNYDDKTAAFATFPFGLYISSNSFEIDYYPGYAIHNYQTRTDYGPNASDSTVVHQTFTYNSQGYTTGRVGFPLLYDYSCK